MKKQSKVWSVSDTEFANLVKSNYCIRDIVEALGYSPTSGSMAIKVKERIERDKLDTSHFLGRQAKASSNPTYSIEEIMVENSTYTNIHRLKIRLVNENILPYECSECGNKGEWNGKPLSLQLDHINGNHQDHRKENLRFLCPNCHSQTDTFSGRNMGRYV